MSTSAQVEAAWDAAIWTDSTILDITDKIYSFDVTTVSEKETGRLNFGSEVNYFQYTIRRAEAVVGTQTLDYQFTVDVQYTRFHDVDGDNWTAVRDVFETLIALVRSDLGTSWSATVDYYRPQDGPLEISQIDFEGEPAWRGTYRFIGYQQISI